MDYKKILDEYCDALDVLKKYGIGSDFKKATGFHLFNFAEKTIVNGLFTFADAIGVTPEKATDRVPKIDDNGDISVKYFFKYRGYEFYDFIKVGNVMEVI